MGLLLGAALGVVVISIIRYRTGMILRGDQTLSYVYWAIFASAVSLTVYRFSRLQPQLFAIKQTIKIGLFAGLLSGTLYTVYITILNNYIDTELAAQAALLNEQEIIEDNPSLTAQEVSNSWNAHKISSTLRGLVYTVVCMVCGIAYAFVSTLVLKKLSPIQDQAPRLDHP